MARFTVAFGILAFLVMSGCTHTVRWDPIHYETPVTREAPRPIALFMEEHLKTARYAFRAFGSGIANEWVVPYGERVHEFAASYLSQMFSDYTEAKSPQVGRGILLHITAVKYEVSGQSAHITIDVVARDAGGQPLLTRSYSAVGPSGAGVIWSGGGAFAQQGMVRRSTNRALHEIFQQLTADLRKVVVQ